MNLTQTQRKSRHGFTNQIKRNILDPEGSVLVRKDLSLCEKEKATIVTETYNIRIKLKFTLWCGTTES